MHFIHPHICWNTRTGTHAGWWFTTLLFSSMLLASSLQHPFVFADRSWQQHLPIHTLSLAPSAHAGTLNCDLLPNLLAQLNSLLCFVFCFFLKKRHGIFLHVNGCYSDVTCSRCARRCAPEPPSTDLWSVSVRIACDELLKRTLLRMVYGGESLQRALLVCLRPHSICGCSDWSIKCVMLR